MIEKINKIKENASREIEAISSPEKLELLRIKYLGKKSEFNQILKELKDLSSKRKEKLDL